tara:strand:+ start:303 stop:890 length:588 start_codon:yes stop_codon:yes gene_type:complete
MHNKAILRIFVYCHFLCKETHKNRQQTHPANGGVRLINSKDCSLTPKVNYLPFLLVILTLGCATNSKNSNGTFCHSDSAQLKNKGCTIDELPSELKKQLSVTLNEGVHKILSNLKPPKYDGGRYSGEITMCLNRSGAVEKVVINEPSGHKKLDSAFLDAVIATDQIVDVPKVECLADYLYFMPIELNYDETDMAH